MTPTIEGTIVDITTWEVWAVVNAANEGLRRAVVFECFSDEVLGAYRAAGV
jgi:hypothetical protein